MIDPTKRFSTRVENYIKYRPGYPADVIATLKDECGLTPDSLVADIGSGTGILAEMFLKNGNLVFAVEPNDEMRLCGERQLHHFARFYNINGRAEATTLSNGSVDFIVAGQAFHWFDQEKARLEFKRILQPAGWTMLVWNDRDDQATPFMEAYERLLQRYAIDYPHVDHRQVDSTSLSQFFSPQGYQSKIFRIQQNFDFDGIRGRLLSSSYVPEEDHANYEPMISELKAIFKAYQSDKHVAFRYKTRMYYGQLT
jgi:SAM-dependent methyltransferase